jgi:hypothetical protein
MGYLPLTVTRQIDRKIKSSLAADCTQCTANATLTIESHQSNRAVKEVWHAFKGWYWVVEDRPAPVCPEMMEKQMVKCMELYAWAPPMGVALTFNFLHFAIPDGVPINKEMHAVVSGLENGQAADATGIRAKHIKAWLGDIWHEEKAARENPGKTANMGELKSKWRIFVQMIQTIWDQGEIPMHMSWMVIVLLPKGGGDFWGIGLLDPCWKVVRKSWCTAWVLLSFTLASMED